MTTEMSRGAPQVPAPIQPVAEELAASRQARCPHCRRTRPSADWQRLAFFEDRGPGSKDATKICKCGYHEVAHDPAEMATRVPGNRRTVIEQGKCTGFVPHGPWEFDSYYCGCRGWD